ncbi:hypothetical protein MP638_001805, partial [Amoeboaphelidium occidentale]
MSKRPPLNERKFISKAVEEYLAGVNLSNPQLNDMYHSCFPNTLDTTVYHFDLKDISGFPDTFIVTGDIPAMWLRDSTNQIIHYLPLVHKDPMLHALILGVLNRQS